MRVSVRIRVNEVVHCGSSARRFAAILADGGYGHLYLEDNESQFGHSCGNGVILFLFFFAEDRGHPTARVTPLFLCGLLCGPKTFLACLTFRHGPKTERLATMREANHLL